MSESVDVVMARMDERLRSLVEKFDTATANHREDLEALNQRIVSLEDRLKKIEEMAVRYKGGFITVLSFGGLIGWLTSNLDFVRSIGNWMRGV